VVSDEELAATLRKSIANSKAKGYHGVEGPKGAVPDNLRSQPSVCTHRVSYSPICAGTGGGVD